ncbi:hypothetical protein MKX03_009542 [Papaver bracteatum]|nr:hypothetical protein MKX03_009542 [Papaver bracteatum]
MARLLTSVVVLLMISVSQVAFAEDIKLGRKGGWVEMERHGSEEQNLSNWQVNQEGANGVVVFANGLVNARPDGRVLEANVWSKNFSDNYAKAFGSALFGGGGSDDDELP